MKSGRPRWLEDGEAVNFSVPTQPGPIISGLRIGNWVLVRRSDFGDQPARKITLQFGKQTLVVPPLTGTCQVIELR